MAKKTISIQLEAELYDAVIARALRRHRYLEQVENPDFDPEQDEGTKNKKMIANPVKAVDFALEKITEEFQEQAIDEIANTEAQQIRKDKRDVHMKKS